MLRGAKLLTAVLTLVLIALSAPPGTKNRPAQPVKTATATAKAKGHMACLACHAKQAHPQPATSMGRALLLPDENSVLHENRDLKLERNGYTYRVVTNGKQSTYSVTDGKETITVPIKWGFGAHTQTFVLEYNGKFYEGLVSYYNGIKGLDVTIGDSGIQTDSLLKAFGRELDDSELRRCFSCHTTGGVEQGKLQLATLTPGIQCERCHTGAAAHMAAIRQGKTKPVPAKLSTMTADELSNFCGQCHRTWDQVMRDRIKGENNVRFQPYRLANSPCYDGSDRRLGCAACHDPHQEVVKGSKPYDKNCLSCHATEQKRCPVAKENCSSCHMPKVELPEGHQAFTDHHIRVVRPGEPYPN